MQPPGRQQGEGDIEEIEVPPIVILDGTQQGGGQWRQQKASQQQPGKAQPGVAENRGRSAQSRPYRYGRAQAAQQ